MSGGGGKGGSQESSSQVQIPKWLENAARNNMARADKIAQLGYTPYYGPDVAAFTPMQTAAMQGTNSAASAFGMAAPSDPMAGMPQPQTFAGGVQGYSSAPLYGQSVNALKANDPGLYKAITSMFINPNTGAQPAAPFGSGAAAGAAARPPVNGGSSRGNSGRRSVNIGSGEGSGGAPSDNRSYIEQSRTASPYTNFRDMFDGGGPGRSGSTFSGGPLSRPLNAVGVRPAGSGGSSSGMGGGK